MAVAISDWYVWGAGISLMISLAVLVFLAWWALFSDRPGNRRRCPRCWYDLSYSPGMTCTECGFEARGEGDLRRIRRRPGIATIAILGCVTIGLFVLDRANTRGWMTYVPTRVVLAAVPLAGNSNSLVLTDLSRRIRSGQFDRSHWLILLDRCRVGDGGARPTSNAWIGKYGRHLDAARSMARRTDDKEWRATLEQILLNIPPKLDLRTRSVWPAGVAPTVDVVARSWWPRDTQWRIRAVPRLPDAQPIEHALLDGAIQRRSYSLKLPTLEPGRHDVALDLTISRRLGPDTEWESFETEPTVVALTVSENTTATLEPISGDLIDTAVRRVFRNGVSKFRGGSLPVRVNVDIAQTFSAILDDTALGVRVDVIRNGKRGRRLDMWWLAGGAGDGSQSAWEVPWHDDAVLGAPASPSDVWTIRARGDLELALRIQGATKYWDGEVSVDVPVHLRNGSAPNRGWLPWDAETSEPTR